MARPVPARKPVTLQLRPNCEYCDKDLPPDTAEARICSYECTFCADCVENHLHNDGPNCGGGFVPRPIRPATARREGTSLEHHPASAARVHLHYDQQEIAAFVKTVKDIPPEER